jgi:hypothetical protein
MPDVTERPEKVAGIFRFEILNLALGKPGKTD